jgi:hypothetical protein
LSKSDLAGLVFAERLFFFVLVGSGKKRRGTRPKRICADYSTRSCLPVENLSLQSKLSVGRVAITMFDATIEKSVLEKFVAMNQQSSSPPEVKNEVEKLFVESLKKNYYYCSCSVFP